MRATVLACPPRTHTLFHVVSEMTLWSWKQVEKLGSVCSVSHTSQWSRWNEVQLLWTVRHRKNAVPSRERRGRPGRNAQPLTPIPELFEFFAWKTGRLSPFPSLLLSPFLLPFLFLSLIFLFIFEFVTALSLHCFMWAFPGCRESGLLSSCGTQPSHGGGLSHWGAQTLGMWASVAVAWGLNCSVACGIFLDQGLSLGPLHFRPDSFPLYLQESPISFT